MLEEQVVVALLEIFSDIGVLGINEENYDEVLENDIRDYIVDSIQFVSFIISVEKKFKISLPESFLFADFSISLGVLIQHILKNISIK